MMCLRHGIVAVLVVFSSGGAPLAQTEADREDQQHSIVRVQSAETNLPGSGIVIGVERDSGRVQVLTARHVVESVQSAGEQAPGCNDIPGRRCCASKPTVFFKSAPQRAFTAVAAYCSVDADVAVLELADVPASVKIPEFQPPNPLNDLPGTPVSLFGAPGSWAHTSDAIISLPPPGARSTAAIQIDARGVSAGYSGGAVLDTQLGFVGMIQRASGITAHAMAARDIKPLLERWQARITHLPDAATQVDNPAFSQGGGGYLAESARNVIRRYRSAFAAMDAVTVASVFPTMPPVSALFGDARYIQFFLTDCSGIPADNASANPVITCEFDLAVFRRTGPVSRSASAGYKPPDKTVTSCVAAQSAGSADCTLSRIAFTLAFVKNDPYVWRITRVSGGERPKVNTNVPERANK